MKRLIILLFFSAIMMAVIIVSMQSFQAGEEYADTKTASELLEVGYIPGEAAMFEREAFALAYKNMPQDETHQRNLAGYYKNRAFHGAPPSIPHPVEDERSMGGKSCLKCHQNGGYVDKWEAYAPVVPHPEKINCRQCHVAQNTESLFKKSNWALEEPNFAGKNAALDGSPPVIPHQLQLHENCLSCHAGPAAPVEIRVSHPERINCRQCHVFNNKETEDIGVFSRKKTMANEE